MITNPTSHFIWLSISPDICRWLFDRLALYIETYDIQNSVELQRLESIHITLYYLGDTVSENEKWIYEQYHNSFPKDWVIYMNNIDYFYRNDSPSILFLLPENGDDFLKQNTLLTSLFQRNDIIDNQFPYIPHITIIRILDSSIFSVHRSEIEKIIKTYIWNMRDISLPYTRALYAVDSQIHPELQEKIL